MVATLVIHVITWITTHLPTPEGWKAELSKVGLCTIVPTYAHVSDIVVSYRGVQRYPSDAKCVTEIFGGK